MSWLSLQDRKRVMLEDMGGCCGGGDGGDGGGDGVTNSVGEDGYQSDANAHGPRAGYDPVLGRAINKIRSNRKRKGKS